MEVTAQQILDCYHCEDDECNETEHEEPFGFCGDAISCWKSTVLDKEGNERYSRGCIEQSDHVQMMCSNRRRLDSPLNARFRIECCDENLCNGGAFPVLQNSSIPNNGKPDGVIGMSPIMLIIAVVVPVLILVTLMFALIYLCQRLSIKKRQRTQPKFVQLVSEYTLSSTELSTNTINISRDSSLQKMWFKFKAFFNGFDNHQKYPTSEYYDALEQGTQTFKTIAL